MSSDEKKIEALEKIGYKSSNIIALKDIWQSNKNDEMKKYLNNVSEVLNDIEQEKRERYNTDDIFKEHKKEQKIQENIMEHKVEMVEYKNSIFKRIINKIKNIFHIN